FGGTALPILTLTPPEENTLAHRQRRASGDTTSCVKSQWLNTVYSARLAAVPRGLLHQGMVPDDARGRAYPLRHRPAWRQGSGPEGQPNYCLLSSFPRKRGISRQQLSPDPRFAGAT